MPKAVAWRSSVCRLVARLDATSDGGVAHGRCCNRNCPGQPAQPGFCFPCRRGSDSTAAMAAARDRSRTIPVTPGPSHRASGIAPAADSEVSRELLRKGRASYAALPASAG
jgi:hypothetical protein